MIKNLIKKLLPLAILLPLAGCWDCKTCTKKDKAAKVEHEGKVAQPKSRCNHAGCKHDHSNDEAHKHNHDKQDHAKHEHKNEAQDENENTEK